MGLNDNATTHLANKEIVNPTTTVVDRPKHIPIQSPVESQLEQDKMIFYGQRHFKCTGQ